LLLSVEDKVLFSDIDVNEYLLSGFSSLKID